MPTTYTVLGTDRRLGAIGIMEPFRCSVEADDADHARDLTRRRRSATREHIHIQAAFEAIEPSDVQMFMDEATGLVAPAAASEATKALEKLRQISDALNAIDCKRCNEPCGPAEDQAESELEKRAAVICKAYGLSLIRQSDPRGRALAIATPKSGRYNGMGGREAGWCI